MSLFREPGVCLFCELQCFYQARQQRLVQTSSWRAVHQQQRSMKTLLKRKPPSRMTLSPRVAESRSQPARDAGPSRRSRASPFAGMNRTDPGPALRSELQRRAAVTRNPLPTGTKSQRKKGKVERKPGDMKALRMQQALSTVPYQHRTQVKAGLNAEDIQSFDAFELRDDVRRGLDSVLAGMEDTGPTPIQRLAIPSLSGYGDHKGRRKALTRRKAQEELQSFLLAAETGSGKTLAYSLPIVNALKDLEDADAQAANQTPAKPNTIRSEYEVEPPPLSSEIDANMAKPQAVILLPSAELVAQVGAVFKMLSHSAKMRVAVVSAANSAKVIRNRLFTSPIDVVISTPALLQSIAQTTPTILSDVRYLVADEADSLFDRSFAPLTSAIIDRATPSMQQLILCSATIPKSLDGYLRSRFPNITRLATPNLHAIPRRVQLSVIDIQRDPYRGNRDLACADTIWQLGRSSGAGIDKVRGGKMILVFVNEREKAPRLADYLRKKGIDAAALTRDAGTRGKDVLTAFTTRTITPTGQPPPEDDDVGNVITEGGRTLPGVKVLIATDLASRGIDTVGVRTVLLYDVPHTSVDFIHRLGRTGRMGRRGRGIVLVGDDDRKDIVREVREGMFMGRALV